MLGTVLLQFIVTTIIYILHSYHITLTHCFSDTLTFRTKRIK